MPAIKHRLIRVLLVCGFALAGMVAAHAQSHPQFVRLSAKVKGALYLPDGDASPRVGILLMHEDANFLVHIACTEFAKRGFAVMCVAGRSDNNEALDTWNELPLDAALGMRYLRDVQKVGKVVLFAHSGGAPLMSYYQAVAEDGVGFCQSERRLVLCPDQLKGLPKADGMVFFDAHPGTAVNLVRSLDPAVVDEDDPRATDKSLDAFDPANGYNPKGPSHYSAEFQARYFKAQADRMTRLVTAAKSRLARIEAGQGPYPDDAPFVIARTNARLMDLDASIGQTTRAPRKLVKNDGSVVTQVIASVHNPDLRLAGRNRSFEEAKQLTLRSFLGARAIRASDSMTGYDITSNNNSTEENLAHIHVPILITSAGGYIFLADDERLFERAVSTDKDYAVIEGATHNVTPCVACETTPGQYSNSVKNAFDTMSTWIDARF